MEVNGNPYLFPPPPSSKRPPSHNFSPPPPPPQKPLSPPPPPPRKLTPSPPPPTPKLTPPPPTPTLAPPPPPQPQPGPPTPPHGNVITIVFVSLSGLFFLAFIAAVLFCFLKKKKKKTAHEKEAVNVEDHIHIHETIVQGPHGEQVVTLSVDEDIKAEKVIMKDELTVAGTHNPRTMKEEPETSSNVIKPYSSS